MEIRRKVFSLAIDENGEEKLFSTCDVELVDASLFSENEKDNKEDDKEKEELRTLDEATYVVDKYLTPKQVRKINRAYMEGRIRETAKEQGKYVAAIGAVGGAGLGAAVGAANGLKHGLGGAAVGAVAGAAGMGAMGAGMGALSAGVNKVRKKINPAYDQKTSRRRDQYDMADGKLSREEFKERHYKSTTNGKRYTK